MENTQTYNGWTNYATWRINLELLDGLDIGDFSFNTNSTLDDSYELGEEIKSYVEDIIEQDSASELVKSYALAFISDVNWYEIAQHKIEEATELA